MKKFLLLAAAFLSLNLYSQSKGTFLLSVNGNYVKRSDGSGTYINQNGTSGKYLEAGISAGSFVSNHIEIGLGLDYYWSSETRATRMLISGDILQMESMEIKSNAFIPNVYTTYHAKIFNRFYFAAKLDVGLGKIKSDEEGVWIFSDNSVGPIIIDDPTGSYRYENSNKYTYFSAGIYPQINYYLTNTLGFSLSLGQVEYSILDWEKNNSTWLASFDPSYWSFGFKLKFDSGKEAQ